MLQLSDCDRGRHLPSKPSTRSWWRGNTGKLSSDRDDDVITSAYVGSTGLDLVAEHCDLHEVSRSFLTDVRCRSSTDIISCADSLFTEPSDLWPAHATDSTCYSSVELVQFSLVNFVDEERRAQTVKCTLCITGRNLTDW